MSIRMIKATLANKSLASNVKADAENAIIKLVLVVQKHVSLLLGLASNNDTHHWTSNGVIAPLDVIHRLTYLKGGKRVKKEWLKQEMYTAFFGEPHSLRGNFLTSLVNKPDYIPLVTRKNFEVNYENLNKVLKKFYSVIIKEILSDEFRHTVVETALQQAITEFQSHIK